MAKHVCALTPMQCRAARALLGWTQQQLAEFSRVSRATIRDFELGKHDAHRSTEQLILEALLAAGITFATDAERGIGVFLKQANSPA